jgi:hypothetical protein
MKIKSYGIWMHVEIITKFNARVGKNISENILMSIAFIVPSANKKVIFFLIIKYFF